MTAPAPSHPGATGERARLSGKRPREDRRTFTPAEDAIIRLSRTGFMRVRDAVHAIGCGYLSFYRRCAELNLPVQRQFRTTTAQLAPLTIPAKAGDPALGGPPSNLDVYSQNCPAAEQSAAGASSPPRSPFSRTVKRRVFTPAEDALIRDVYARKISQDAAVRYMRTSAETFRARASELGLGALPKGAMTGSRATSQFPDCPPGWFPIAHGTQGKWRLYDGSPVTIEAARAAVEAGKATMAQKRVDGGFDLMFRVRA